MEEDKLYTELKQLRYLLAKVVGTQDLPKRDQFSKEAVKKAASEFRKLQTQRGEWVPEDDISKIIRTAGYHRPGRFIIEKFNFKNYFIRARTYYFSRNDLVALNKELKARKINLGLYMDLEEDKEKFHKYLTDLRQGKKRRPRFKIPENLTDITSEPYNHPPKEKVLKHIDSLMEEYESFKLNEFIDIFQDDYARVKHIYYFDRYIEPVKRKQCDKWCFEFNYAQTALKEIKKIRSQVIY
ncbi:hypothetical protein [Marinifilum sp. D714]|uniref:hypothetical protein n=1 Tax=Marinifilum sp. D714 TaxID=2937523 RepID=UPI0027C01F2A|nr:hypothetical protein [Marinifilum sp. D714]MDQ2178798.1 hypothetical protein [Marinifilum sp. D714]